jgi:hypothetical protein
MTTETVAAIIGAAAALIGVLVGAFVQHWLEQKRYERMLERQKTLEIEKELRRIERDFALKLGQLTAAVGAKSDELTELMPGPRNLDQIGDDLLLGRLRQWRERRERPLNATQTDGTSGNTNAPPASSCPSCGASTRPDHLYCPNCGHLLDPSTCVATAE